MEFIRNGIVMAIVAQGVIGISLLWDKILLRRPATQNLLSYVFWMGAMSVFGLILIGFGFQMPTIATALEAFGAGALQLVALLFYYLALKRGEASEALAVMGGFSPLATVLFAWALLSIPLARAHVAGFVLMVAGGFVMFFTEKFSIRELLPPVLLASGLYGIVNVVQKIAFNHTNFVTAYVFFTFGTFVGALVLLIPSSWRRQIFESTEEINPRSRAGYLINRFMNGVGSFLVFYAISLANPAMVDAISSVRYVIIFAGAYLLTQWKPQWLRENFDGPVLVGKAIATLMVAAGLVLVAVK